MGCPQALQNWAPSPTFAPHLEQKGIDPPARLKGNARVNGKESANRNEGETATSIGIRQARSEMKPKRAPSEAEFSFG
jgi:hypothetical protein